MKKFYPMEMTPCYKDYIWGGNKLRTRYGKSSLQDRIAESWEFSGHSDGETVIANGTFQGIALQALIEQYGPSLLGTKSKQSSEIPILIKWIDAKQDLSIQVHPSDDTADRLKGQRGKAEMWYIVDQEPGAFLYCGFQTEISPGIVRNAVADGTICNYLNKIEVKKGDVIFILPGTVHALGKGILIAEIQQSSNTTFRLFDYNRRNQDGILRELHVEEALHVANLTPSIQAEKDKDCVRVQDGWSICELFQCQYFSVEKIVVEKQALLLCDETSFHALLILSGNGWIQMNDKKYLFSAGSCHFIPAGSGEYQIEGNCEILLSKL